MIGVRGNAACDVSALTHGLVQFRGIIDLADSLVGVRNDGVKRIGEAISGPYNSVNHELERTCTSARAHTALNQAYVGVYTVAKEIDTTSPEAVHAMLADARTSVDDAARHAGIDLEAAVDHDIDECPTWLRVASQGQSSYDRIALERIERADIHPDLADMTVEDAKSREAMRTPVAGGGIRAERVRAEHVRLFGPLMDQLVRDASLLRERPLDDIALEGHSVHVKPGATKFAELLPAGIKPHVTLDPQIAEVSISPPGTGISNGESIPVLIGDHGKELALAQIDAARALDAIINRRMHRDIEHVGHAEEQLLQRTTFQEVKITSAILEGVARSPARRPCSHRAGWTTSIRSSCSTRSSRAISSIASPRDHSGWSHHSSEAGNSRSRRSTVAPNGRLKLGNVNAGPSSARSRHNALPAPAKSPQTGLGCPVALRPLLGDGTRGSETPLHQLDA